MRLRRGLLRMWVVASAIWVLAMFIPFEPIHMLNVLVHPPPAAKAEFPSCDITLAPSSALAAPFGRDDPILPELPPGFVLDKRPDADGPFGSRDVVVAGSLIDHAQASRLIAPDLDLWERMAVERQLQAKLDAAPGSSATPEDVAAFASCARSGGPIVEARFDLDNARYELGAFLMVAVGVPVLLLVAGLVVTWVVAWVVRGFARSR